MKLTKSKLQEIIKEEIEEELVQQAESIENIQELSDFVLKAKALYQEEGKTKTLEYAVEQALDSLDPLYDKYAGEEHSQRVIPDYVDEADALVDLEDELFKIRDLLNEL